MMRIKRVERLCGWIAAFLLTSNLLPGCFARLETMQAGDNQVDVQAISPLPTALATLPPESTAQPSPSPTFYWPPTPPAVTGEAQRGPSPTPSATPSRIVNLAEGLPDGEIYVCYVLRADGTVEQYRLPVKPLEVAKNFIDARNELLNLKAGDIVMNGYSLATPPPRQVPFP